MNGDLSKNAQLEEAIAELYRDYADGKVELKPRPKTIFGKILSFFKALFTSHKEIGFNKAGDIFKNIGTKEFTDRIAQAEKGKRNVNLLQDSIDQESKSSITSIIPDEVLANAQGRISIIGKTLQIKIK